MGVRAGHVPEQAAFRSDVDAVLQGQVADDRLRIARGDERRERMVAEQARDRGLVVDGEWARRVDAH